MKNMRRKPTIPVVHKIAELYNGAYIAACSIYIYPDGPAYEETEEKVSCKKCLQNIKLYGKLAPKANTGR